MPVPIDAAALAASISGAVDHPSNVLSAKHLARILGGLLYAASCAVPWTILHARTFEHDVLECCCCGGHLRVKAVVVAPEEAQAILASVSAAKAQQARGPPVEVSSGAS